MIHYFRLKKIKTITQLTLFLFGFHLTSFTQSTKNSDAVEQPEILFRLKFEDRSRIDVWKNCRHCHPPKK